MGIQWQADVQRTWVRVAAERGIDFDPAPDTVAAALPSLVATMAHYLPEGPHRLDDDAERDAGGG